MTAARSECIPTVVLSSSVGHRAMPVLGLGTASFSSDSDLLKTAVLEAIKLGYRHFDTAAMYGSEQALGEAIAEAPKHGLVGSRNELFITTKLWCNDAHPSLVIPALKKSLQNLQLEYLDLYLVHWPFSAKPGKLEYPIKEEDVMPLDYNSVWADMEESQRLGLTRSIGVSNFTTKKLQNLLSFAKIPPSVNQVEMNPIWQQKKLIQFCKANLLFVITNSKILFKNNKK
nr:non-functional NADPH-dependent codeinone reductase 2-like [Ziziphus jujuba var. spinosa]